MKLYVYHVGTCVPTLTIEDVVSWTSNKIVTADGTIYGPLAEDVELSETPDCIGTLRADWEASHPSFNADIAALKSVIYLSRLQLAGEAVDTDDKRIRASGLYPDWTPGSHPKGEICNAAGQTWEVFQAYDNAVYPEIRPGEAAWHTFNRPLHGTSPETARPWCKPRHGTTDIYHTGEYMIWTDGSLYRCLRDTDFSPGEYPADWEIVSKSDT